MPKLKPHKGLKKRVRVSKRRKILRQPAGKSHLMSGKTGKRKRHLRRTTTFHETDLRKIRRLLVIGNP